MDWAHLTILAVGAGFVLGGARMMYCGHRQARAGGHDRRRLADRRRAVRRRAP